MIPRYSRPDMVAIWTPEARFRIWFEIESHATDALAELGVVPKEAAAAIWERGAFEVDRIDEIERNHEAFVNRGQIAASAAVKKLVPAAPSRLRAALPSALASNA